MNHSAPADGLWLLVILNSAAFIVALPRFLPRFGTSAPATQGRS